MEMYLQHYNPDTGETIRSLEEPIVWEGTDQQMI